MTATVRCALRTTQLVVSVAEVRAVLERLLVLAGKPDWSVGCQLTTDRTLARLNATYRGARGPTDILSFAFHDELSAPERFPLTAAAAERDLGDMFIAVPYVRRVCQAEGLDEAAHYRTLLVHGVTHLLGYDHASDEQFAAMAARERELLAGLRGGGVELQ